MLLLLRFHTHWITDRLNAFDLMSCAGGLALDNLFNYHRGSHASWKYVLSHTPACDCFDCFPFLELTNYNFIL